MKNMRQTFLVLLGAVSLATMAGLAQTASTNATKPGDKLASLFPDTVLAKGKGFEVKRSQLDDEVIKIKAQYAASGRTLPPDQADMMEKNILNGLIQMELLHLRATDADKAKGKEQFEKALQAVKDEQKLTDAELDEKLAPQLRLQHISKEQWQKQQMDQTTLEATIERELKVSISDEDVKKFYDDNPSKFEQPEMVRAAHVLLATQDLKTKTDLPEAQKAALHSLVKAPLVYSIVALRNWRAFSKLGVEQIYAPGSYHPLVKLNAKVDVGSYRSSSAPDEPILLRMVRVPCKPGLSEHEQNKAGRAELLATPFATFEHNIRDQLSRMLRGGGFDPATDIEAITVNRWPHGYAPEYNPLWDPEVPPQQRANVLGRAPFGRMTIANSDSGAAAYTDSAIDQADRAVNELLRPQG